MYLVFQGTIILWIFAGICVRSIKKGSTACPSKITPRYVTH